MKVFNTRYTRSTEKFISLDMYIANIITIFIQIQSYWNQILKASMTKLYMNKISEKSKPNKTVYI